MCPSVCPSVCLSYLAPQPRRAAGLLLWAQRAADIDRLLRGASAAGAAAIRSLSTAARRSAANASKCRVYSDVGRLYMKQMFK